MSLVQRRLRPCNSAAAGAVYVQKNRCNSSILYHPMTLKRGHFPHLKNNNNKKLQNGPPPTHYAMRYDWSQSSSVTGVSLPATQYFPIRASDFIWMKLYCPRYLPPSIFTPGPKRTWKQPGRAARGCARLRFSWSFPWKVNPRLQCKPNFPVTWPHLGSAKLQCPWKANSLIVIKSLVGFILGPRKRSALQLDATLRLSLAPVSLPLT